MKKKGLVLALCFLLLLTSMILPASANSTLSALSAKDVKSFSRREDGYCPSKGGAYLGFENVDLTGIRSVAVTAKNNMLAGGDGDVLQLRLDAPNGLYIGAVDLDVHTPNEYYVFRGAIETPISGVHKLYVVSTFGYSNYTTVQSIELSTDNYTPKAYEPVPETNIIDRHDSTWALTDDLGRKAATYEEVGPLKEGKYVGMFYWTWHAGFESASPLNMSEFAKAHPEAKYDYYNEAWPAGSISYFWNEPLFGYYSGIDYWVYRKHAEMLSSAGVDALFFDCTNGTSTWRREYQVLFSALHDARAAGTNAPKVVFITPFSPTNASTKENVTRLYLGAYEGGKYSDLWFYWDGKPLLLAYTDTLKGTPGDDHDIELMEDIKDFFTFRGPQPSYVTGQVQPNQWGWLERYPQNGYTQKGDGSFEEVTVGVGVNHSYVTWNMTAMNDNFAMGRSYTNLLGQDKSAGAYKYGYFFEEQLKHALTIDADMMFIDGWNEWRAGRYTTWGGISNASPDTYDNEGSRDMEPTVGDMKDNYYCLLVDAVRKWKGAEKVPVAGEAKTIALNDFHAWDSVTPEYFNARGTYDRNYIGYGSVQYENYTARNNVVKSKVSRDADNLYFLAECYYPVTEPSGDAWMKLYIDTDRNHATGWEGYDFVINYPAAGDVTDLASGAVIGKADYVVEGEKLALRVSRSLLGLAGSLNFEFKWVDNASGDILNFYVDGNAAPLGRFNYVYTERAEVSLSLAERQALSGVTLVKSGSSAAYVSGAKMYLYEPDTRYGARLIDGVLYIPSAILNDAQTYRTEFDATRQMLKLKGEHLVYTTVGSTEVRVDGVLKTLSNPVKDIDGIPYIPLSFLTETLNLAAQTYESYGAFGKASVMENVMAGSADISAIVGKVQF